jgi:hypothetical protein
MPPTAASAAGGHITDRNRLSVAGCPDLAAESVTSLCRGCRALREPHDRLTVASGPGQRLPIERQQVVQSLAGRRRQIIVG